MTCGWRLNVWMSFIRLQRTHHKEAAAASCRLRPANTVRRKKKIQGDFSLVAPSQHTNREHTQSFILKHKKVEAFFQICVEVCKRQQQDRGDNVFGVFISVHSPPSITDVKRESTSPRPAVVLLCGETWLHHNTLRFVHFPFPAARSRLKAG